MHRLMKYVFWRTTASFFWGFCALEGLLLTSAIYDLSTIGSRWGVTTATLLKSIPFLLLERATMVIPLAAASAGAHVFSEMAAGNELIAVQSMGKDVRRLLFPLLAMGVVFVILSLAADELGKGYGVRRIESMAVSDAEKMLENRFKSGESIDLGSGGMHYWLTMRQGGSDALPWVSVLYYRELSLHLVAAGEMRSFHWLRDPDGAHGIVLELENIVGQEPGKGLLRMEKGTFTCTTGNGADRIFLGNKAANRSIAGNIRASGELKENIRKQYVEVMRLLIDAGYYTVEINKIPNGATIVLNQELARLDRMNKELLQSRAGIHIAIGLALAPIPLLLVGAAFGATVRFKNRTSAFLGTILIVVLVYYPVLTATRGFIEGGMTAGAALPYLLDGLSMFFGFVLWRRIAWGVD